MKRWERPLLLFSLALNIAFASVAATHAVRDLDSERRTHERTVWRADDGALRDRHARRGKRLARVLALDAEQRRHFAAGFDRAAPALRESRRRVWQARAAYRDAVVRGDAEAARRATQAVSRAQAAVDSICAEAMLAETAALRPEQRRAYVRMTLRAENGPGRGRRGFRDAPPPGGPPAPRMH